MGINTGIGTRLLGLLLRRLSPLAEWDAGEQAVRDWNNLAYLSSNKHLLKPWLTTPPPKLVSIQQQMLQPMTKDVQEMYQMLADATWIPRGVRIASCLLISGIVILYRFFTSKWDNDRFVVYGGVGTACCCIGLLMFNKSTIWRKDKGGGKIVQKLLSSTPEVICGILASSLLYLAIVECSESFLSSSSALTALPWIIFVCPGYILPHKQSLRVLVVGGLLVVWYIALNLPLTPAATFKGMVLLPPSSAIALRWLSLIPSIVLFLYTRSCMWCRCEVSLELAKQCEMLMTVHLKKQIRETIVMMLDIFPPSSWILLAPYLPVPPPPLNGEREMLESLPLAGEIAVVLQHTWVIYIDVVSLKKMEGILSPTEMSVVIQKVALILYRGMSAQVCSNVIPLHTPDIREVGSSKFSFLL